MISNIMKLLTSLLLLLPVVLAAGNKYPIKGVHTNGVKPRHEIRDLQFNYPNQFNMFILALSAFQADKQGAKLSYYQVEGIHGVPNIPWDHVKQKSDGTGYCMHDSNLFPTWHRPYVALYEQRIHHHAMQIASQFPAGPQRKAMEGAARMLRAPYFDWAIDPAPGTPTWPAVMGKPRISVRTPHGAKTIRNPLFSYHYHSLQSQWYASPWNAWSQTLRWPTGSGPGSQSQNNLVDQTLQQQRPGTKYTLFQFFTNCKSWLEISNDKVSHSHPGCATSLEQLHNNVHNFIGGTVTGQLGHMTVIPYSAHDPSFMLHHNQIDRLLALWQAVYPDHWVPKQAQKDNTFDSTAGTVMGRNSPLKPFHRTKKGAFWTSDKVRKTSVFGYTYPEYLHGGNKPNAMRSRIKKLYGPNSSAHAAHKSHSKIKKRSLDDELWYDTNEEAMEEVVRREIEEEEAATRDTILARSGSPPVSTPLLANNGSSYQYIANIQTTRYGLGGSYNIYLFMSEPSNSDPTTWAYDPNVVGAYGVWSEPGKESYNVTSTSSIPLTLALTDLVQNGILEALNNIFVVPFLASKLEWKIVGPDGSILDPSDVPDFKISVVSSTLAPPTSEDEFPVWSDFIELPDITSGKAGGSLGGMLGGLIGDGLDGLGGLLGGGTD